MCHAFRILVFALALATTARADFVTINFNGVDLRNQSNTPLTNGSLVLVLANVATPSTAGSGFGTLSAGALSVGSILNGTYQVLGRTEIDDSFGTADAAGQTLPISIGSTPYTNLSLGDQLAVLWFPTLTQADFNLVSGTVYGLYTQNSTPAWTISVGTITITTASELTASFVSAIPEPSTYAALAGVGALVLAGYRRSRRATAA